jgi:hypothetical protein
MNRTKKLLSLSGIFALLISVLNIIPAPAQTSGVALDFAGAAQILFRAAIAALLNEAYYGADYPGATSTSALITKVNEVLATNARAQYLALASYYDYWNNAVHASLP